MWVFKAIIFIHFSAACAAQDVGDVVPTMHLQPEWSEIFPSEQVKLKCDTDNSGNWIVTWYKDGKELQRQDHNLIPSEDSSELTLTAASQAQSGRYSCKGVDKTNPSLTTKDSNTVQLTIHGEKLKPALSIDVTYQKIFVGESVTFTCLIHMSSPWEYVWFHNDNPIHRSSQNVYTITAELSHSTYYCKARRGAQLVSTDQSNNVTLKVSDVPVPTVKLRSSWSDVIVNEMVLLSCESVGPDWSFTWFRAGEPLKESSNLKITGQGGAQLHLLSVPKSFGGLYTCKARHNKRHVSSGQSPALSITVHDIPKPTLSKNPLYSSAYVGETVTFTCGVASSSGWKYKWYKDDKEISNTDSTISIPLALSDGGQYSCKAHRGKTTTTHTSDKMTQAVDDVPVPSIKLISPWPDVFVNEVVKLGCEASSTDWSFSWLKNGVPLSGDSTLEITEHGANLQIDSVSRGHMGGYSCKAHHKTRNVTSEQSRPLELKVYVHVLEAGKMDKHEDLSGFVHFQIVARRLGQSIFKIAALVGRFQSAVVHGRNSDEPATENTPKPTMTKDPIYSTMYVGEIVKYVCSVDVASGWKFKWFKDDREIVFNGSTINIPLGPSDGGKYSCKATRGGRTTTESSDKITLAVLEIPVPTVKGLTEWLDVFPTETVELGCGMPSAPSDWTYEWHKDDQMIGWDTASFDPDKATLTIRSASAAHKGQYKCRGILKPKRVTSSFSSGLTLTLYDRKPQPVLVQDPDYSILFPKEQLSLQCHINVSSGWEYVWYNDNKQLNVNKNKYEVNSPDPANSGSYKCKARRGKTHSFITDLSQVKTVEIRKDLPEPVLSQVPDVKKVYVGELVIFKCTLNISSDWEYHWYKDGQDISVVSNGFSVMDAKDSDSGNYTCKARRRRKTPFITESQPKVIRIHEIPTPSVKNLTEWLDPFPTETVMLSCGMEIEASDWSYEWHKDGQPLPSDGSVSLNQDGNILTITSSQSHTGEYSCMGRHKNRPNGPVQSNYSLGIELKVYDATPGVELVQDPTDDVFYTEDLVYFTCGVMVSSGWEYMWYKNNQLVGSGQNHTISNLHTSHSGEYKCRSKRGKGKVFHTDDSRGVKIEVHERPSAAILLLTGWSEVFSTDSLVLKCEAKDTLTDWEFRWFKGGEKILQPFSEKHTITPQNDPDQSQYMCQGFRNGTPAYTKRSEPLKTNNLLLKRRVLLSISGCLVFGICAVFLGCIALRIFRKPVLDQEKPEEVGLFATRAELTKHAPNPLAEYVTDEDIKELAKEPKEEDENGTICSESTPLPITSQEDEAAPSESNSASGNGEMVSFKQ